MLLFLLLLFVAGVLVVLRGFWRFYDTFYTQNERFLVPIILWINSFETALHSAKE